MVSLSSKNWLLYQSREDKIAFQHIFEGGQLILEIGYAVAILLAVVISAVFGIGAGSSVDFDLLLRTDDLIHKSDLFGDDFVLLLQKLLTG